MKLLEAFLVAVFAFSIVVNGTPTKVEINPIEAFGRFEEFMSNIQCIYNVVDEFMDESNVDDVWHTAKLQLKSIVDIEWKNCLKMDDGDEKEKCKSVVMGHGVHVFTKYLDELLWDHKLDLDWHKLRTNISSKCF